MLYLGTSYPKKFNLTSWMIKTFEKTKSSHAFIIWENKDLQLDFIFHSTGAGVNVMLLEKFLATHNLISIKKLEIESELIPTRWLLSMMGKGYSVIQNISICIMRITRKKIKLANNNMEEFNCTEYASTFATQFSKNLKFNGDLDYIGVKEIEKALCQK